MQKQPCTEIWVYLEHSTLDSPLWPRLYYFLTIAGWLILKTTMVHQHASLCEKKLKNTRMKVLFHVTIIDQLHLPYLKLILMGFLKRNNFQEYSCLFTSSDRNVTNIIVNNAPTC